MPIISKSEQQAMGMDRVYAFSCARRAVSWARAARERGEMVAVVQFMGSVKFWRQVAKGCV